MMKLRFSIITAIAVASSVFAAEQAIKQDSYTHKIIKPPVSAGASFDIDCSLVTTNCGGGGGGTPGGVSSQAQYNNAGAFGGIPYLTYNGTAVTQQVGATRYILADQTDNTKKVTLDLSPISTATTRNVYFPDSNMRMLTGSATSASLVTNTNTTNQLNLINTGNASNASIELTLTGNAAHLGRLFIDSDNYSVVGIIQGGNLNLVTDSALNIGAGGSPIRFSNDSLQTEGAAFNFGQTVASGASATLDEVKIDGKTTTVTGSTNITTVKGFNKFSIYKPTYTDSSAVTITNAATLYIEDAPAIGGSLSITNPYAFWVNSGTTRLGGNVTLGGTITAAGSNTQVLFNDGGVVGADADFTWDKTGNILNFATGSLISWNADTGLYRNAAGTVEINNGTAGQYRDLQARNAKLDGGVLDLHPSPGGVRLTQGGGGTSLAFSVASATSLTLTANAVFVPTANIINWNNDIGVARNAAGVLEIDNGTAGQYRDLQHRSSLFSGATSGNTTVSAMAIAGTGTVTLPQSGKIEAAQGVVTSTTDQTATTETAHVVYTVPANTAQAGATYHIVAWGDIDNGTTAITFTPRIRWGGTGGVQLIATPTIVGTTTAQTNKTWRMDALVTIRTIGASGTAFTETQLSNHTASTTGVYAQDDANSGGTGVTIDTTANKDLDLTWTLSATTGTPHLRTYGGYIEIIN